MATTRQLLLLPLFGLQLASASGCAEDDVNPADARAATWALINTLDPTISFFFDDPEGTYAHPGGGTVESAEGIYDAAGRGFCDCYVYGCEEDGIVIDSPGGVVFNNDPGFGLHGTAKFSGKFDFECKYSSADQASASTWTGSICGMDANDVMGGSSDDVNAAAATAASDSR